MKLFLVTQEQNDACDAFCGAIVVATDEESARNTDVAAMKDWCSPEHLSVKYLGDADSDMPTGVVVAWIEARYC